MLEEKLKIQDGKRCKWQKGGVAGLTYEGEMPLNGNVDFISDPVGSHRKFISKVVDWSG